MGTPLALGNALAGRYELQREIGRGGMATVYLARDVRHERLVALKLLDPELGALLGADRFLSEIRVTANLQHPNLLPLFDSGEANGLLFYIMPFVDGESLRTRLDRERQLPVDEAIRIAVAIASALDYAHRHGVIHRDLKPENVLLHDGQPLVADFGIALALSRAGGTRLTQTGLSLGTPQYMSPEQATGDRTTDARTDIYALGAVLYEMLTGDPPHSGSNAQAIIAKVLTEKAPHARLARESVPEHVDAAIERALAQLPADRFASVREFADALQPLPTMPGAATAARTGRRALRSPARMIGPLGAMAPWLLALVIATAWGVREVRRPHELRSAPVRFLIDLPEDDPLVQGIAISPDGSQIVYAGPSGLMLRPVGDLTLRPLPGTAGASAPFFSPDGAWIGFLAEAKLKKVRTSGGPPVVIRDSLGTLGGAAWMPDGQIVFTGKNLGLASISANGGRVRTITTPSPGERHLWPDALPGDDGVVFTMWRGALQTAELAVATPDGRVTRLGLNGMNSRYVKDRLVFTREDGTLESIAFDPTHRRVGSEQHLAGETVELVQVFNPGAANYAVSASGALVYAPGALPNQAVIVDRAGTLRPLPLEPRTYARPRYSPDGRHVLFDTRTNAFGELWLYDIGSSTMQRLFAGDDVHQPEWSPDGKLISFTARSTTTGEDLFVMPLDGSAPPAKVLGAANDQYDATWTPDGRSLVFVADDPFQNFGVVRLTDGRQTKWLDGGSLGGTLLGPRVSPDGHWIAYWSNESGRDEVYIRPFPRNGGVVQVSSGGGTEPVWSRDGHELFYRQDDRLIAATLAPGAHLSVSGRHLLFADRFVTDGGHAYYDVSPDGRSFIFLKDTQSTAQLVVVLNWSETLTHDDTSR